MVATYQQLEEISRTAKNLKGEWEVRCLGLVITRRNSMSQAITAAKKFQEQTDATVTVHHRDN